MERVLPIAIAALLLSGCAMSAGPVVVHAPSLGFSSPYLGLTVRGDIVRERLIARAEASYLDAQKIQTGDGYGGNAEALAGAKWGRWSALAGLRGNRYVTSAYSKNSYQYLAQGGYHFKSGGIVSATGSLEADGSGWYSYGARCEVPMKRVLIVSTWEHLMFDAQNGDRTIGDRVSLAALWKF